MVRKDEGRPRFRHVHASELQERGVPLGLVETHHSSQRPSFPNIEARGSCSVLLRRILRKPVAVADAQLHSFLRVAVLAAQLECSVTAKWTTHSVAHLTEEQVVISHHVLNHSLTMGDVMAELSWANTYFATHSPKLRTDAAASRGVSCPVVSRRVMSCCLELCHAEMRHVESCGVVSCPFISCRAVSCRDMS